LGSAFASCVRDLPFRPAWSSVRLENLLRPRIVVPPDLATGVYVWRCSCSALYVGQTSCSFRERTASHYGALRRYISRRVNDGSSALVHHLTLNASPDCSWGSAPIFLKSLPPDLSSLVAAEALFLRLLPPSRLVNGSAEDAEVTHVSKCVSDIDFGWLVFLRDAMQNDVDFVCRTVDESLSPIVLPPVRRLSVRQRSSLDPPVPDVDLPGPDADWSVSLNAAVSQIPLTFPLPVIPASPTDSCESADDPC
jgi:hypothetical protein